jgi:hypothetical protein
LTGIGKLGTTKAVTDSFICNDGGDGFLQNVGSYKSHATC